MDSSRITTHATCKLFCKKFLLLLIFPMIHADIIWVKLPDGTEVDYCIGKKVGEGSFATVYEGVYKNLKENGIYAAFKISSDKDGIEQMNNEIRIYKHLCATSDSNPAELHEAVDAGIPVLYAHGVITKCEPDSLNLVSQAVLIMELLAMELFNVIFDKYGNRKELSWSSWLEIGINLFKVLEFLHRKGVIHGDIRLENFAVRNFNPWSLCVLDFGGARLSNDKNGCLLTGGWYNRSYCTTIRILQYLGLLPQAYLQVLQNMPKYPDEDDDLESVAISFWDIKVTGAWAAAEETYKIYNKINIFCGNMHKLPNDQLQEHLQNLTDEEKLVAKQSSDQRMLNTLQALFDVIFSKQKFPDDIVSARAKNAALPPGSVEVIRDVLLYSRRSLPEYKQITWQWSSTSDFARNVILQLHHINNELLKQKNDSISCAHLLNNGPGIPGVPPQEIVAEG